jgi:hypothetical protein
MLPPSVDTVVLGCFVVTLMYFVVFLLFFLLVVVGFSLLVPMWVDLVVDTIAIGDRSTSSIDSVREPSVLIIHRHPLGCYFSCLLVGVQKGFSDFLKFVPLDFALFIAFCSLS